ncbi:hypothetical protein LWI28_007714 [Acer negundo]|uniref:Retrotransposon Copia-like N-terminal domain-containing protein n=1 Tax=Acer negundo TaxID=4023 RepID=A0AAD5JCS4_ACENE|nr:hypothetical protein LWI28_007714 [Acer negundo]
MMSGSNSSNLPCANDGSFSSLPTAIDLNSLGKALNFHVSLKLDTTNYIYWKAQVLPVIRALDLDDIVLGLKICPEKFVESTSTTQNGVEKEIAVNIAYTTWRRADQMLLGCLLSTISKEVLGQILGDSLRAAGQVVSEYDMVLSAVNGLGHDYDVVVMLITSQHKLMSLQEAQFMAMMHEQRLQHLIGVSHDLVTGASAQFIANNGGNSRGSYSNNVGGGRNNNGRGRGRGKSRWTNNNRLVCQLCNKPSNVVLQCYMRFDQSFQGNNQYHNGWNFQQQNAHN